MPHNYNDGCKITQENWEEHYFVPEVKGKNWKKEIEKGREIFDKKVYAIPYAGDKYVELATILIEKVLKEEIRWKDYGGVRAWRNHGDQYGYFKFFENRIREEVREEFDSIFNKVFLVNKKHQAFTTEQWNEEIAPLFREMLALLKPNI